MFEPVARSLDGPRLAVALASVLVEFSLHLQGQDFSNDLCSTNTNLLPQNQAAECLPSKLHAEPHLLLLHLKACS